MDRDGRGFAIAALLALGAAALAFAWWPGPWPNPLPPGPLRPALALPRLRATAGAVDAAARRGDVAAFAAATTDGHRTDLARRLRAVDRELDGATLRALGAEGGQAAWLERPLLAGEVRGNRIVVAVARDGGEGAQVLAFVWDGLRLAFDGSHHAVGVADAATAATRIAASFAADR
ncbi:MAG: hypothetical protein KF830_07870 [Planctomycetes bacterium]|nr:hypothetical protein [Planctomycetota bacterium]